MKHSEKTKYIKLSLYLLIPIALIWSYKFFVTGPSSELVSLTKTVQANDVLPEVVSYNFDVKPILSDKCYTCHGPDQEARQANLRLDT